MTIERGSNWGEIVTSREATPIARGDLACELGTATRLGDSHAGRWLRLPLDVLEISALDTRGRRHEASVTSWMIAGSPIRGEFVIVSSTSFVEGRRIFSRAHPNDGRLDWLVMDPSMSWRQRRAFRRRTRTESHVPHPLVTVGSGSSFSRTFGHPLSLRFETAGPIRDVVEVTVTLQPDAEVTHIPAP